MVHPITPITNIPILSILISILPYLHVYLFILFSSIALKSGSLCSAVYSQFFTFFRVFAIQCPLRAVQCPHRLKDGSVKIVPFVSRLHTGRAWQYTIPSRYLRYLYKCSLWGSQLLNWNFLNFQIWPDSSLVTLKGRNQYTTLKGHTTDFLLHPRGKLLMSRMTFLMIPCSETYS